MVATEIQNQVQVLSSLHPTEAAKGRRRTRPKGLPQRAAVTGAGETENEGGA